MLTFCIRDDDTGFFTRPEDLEEIYGGIWDRAPVSLAVVPFQLGTGWTKSPVRVPDPHRPFPLAANPALVAWLREGVANRRLAVMQHGYSHGEVAGAYEFRDDGDLKRKVREGRRHLEETLVQPVSVFVPPHNSFSRRGFSAVVEAGLHIANIPSFRPQVRGFSLRDIGAYLRYKQVVRRLNPSGFQYPWVLRLSNHNELACYGLVPGVTFEKLKAGVDFARSRNGIFCLATHYWELAARPELHAVLQQLVDYGLNLPDVRPATIPEVLR